MKAYFLSICFLLESCTANLGSTLEMNFTSQNNDSLTELKSFSLTTIDVKRIQDIKTISFENVKCEAPNRFILRNIKAGVYFGLMQVENKERNDNISFDSISVKPGKNYLTKELILGHIHL